MRKGLLLIKGGGGQGTNYSAVAAVAAVASVTLVAWDSMRHYSHSTVHVQCML